MKYIIFILIAMLCSCSVNYHINKATKKGFKCAETSDTIQILKIDSIPYVVNDSIYYETIIRKTDSVIFYNNRTNIETLTWTALRSKHGY